MRVLRDVTRFRGPLVLCATRLARLHFRLAHREHPSGARTLMPCIVAQGSCTRDHQEMVQWEATSRQRERPRAPAGKRRDSSRGSWKSGGRWATLNDVASAPRGPPSRSPETRTCTGRPGIGAGTRTRRQIAGTAGHQCRGALHTLGADLHQGSAHAAHGRVLTGQTRCSDRSNRHGRSHQEVPDCRQRAPDLNRPGGHPHQQVRQRLDLFREAH